MSERNRTADEVTGTICAELQESGMTIEEQVALLNDIEWDLVQQLRKQNLLKRFTEGRWNEP